MKYVYKLIDPRDNLPFYVGLTRRPNVRFHQHLTPATTNRVKRLRIAAIVSAGLSPRMEIIEPVEEEIAKEREIFWILEYLAQGYDLTNVRYNENDTNPMLEYLQHADIISSAFAFYLQQQGINDGVPLDAYTSLLENFVAKASSIIPRKRKEITRLEQWKSRQTWNMLYPDQPPCSF